MEIAKRYKVEKTADATTLAAISKRAHSAVWHAARTKYIKSGDAKDVASQKARDMASSCMNKWRVWNEVVAE